MYFHLLGFLLKGTKPFLHRIIRWPHMGSIRNVHFWRLIIGKKIVHGVGRHSKAWWGINILYHNMLKVVP